MQNILIKTCLFYKATTIGIQFLIQLDRTHLLEMKEFVKEIFSVFSFIFAPLPRLYFLIKNSGTIMRKLRFFFCSFVRQYRGLFNCSLAVISVVGIINVP